MAIDIGPPRGPLRTRALLEELAGGRRAVQLRAQVAAARRGATSEQVEEAFQEACLRAGLSCRGQSMGEVYKWLLKTTESLVDDMRDRLRREVLVDHAATEFKGIDPSLAPPDEVLIKREDRVEVTDVTRAILDRLDERGRKVAALHSHGLARKEIARHLGVTPRIVKRDVEGILATGREQLARIVGFGCPDGHRLVSRYAFGLGRAREAHHAQLHLMTCARCAAMYERLDLWRERVAALLPVPPLVDAKAGIVERVVQVGGEVLSSGTGAPSPAPTGIRRHVVDGVAHLRDQAAGVYYRTVDPTPLAGIRPGAVAAAVAGCLAVGGGATYCAQQGADPFGAFSRLTAPSHREQEKPKPPPKGARAAQPAAPPVVTTTVAPPPAPPPTSAQTTRAAALPPAPEDEFEPTSPGATVTSVSTKPRREPQPAPAEGPIGEFDGP